MAEIKFEHISKFYGKQPVIHDLNLTITSGSFTVLVGPSGCGKSTLLRLIAGLEVPDSGKLYLDGKCVNDVEPKDRDIAIVFQNYALYPHMTVYENMAFGLKIRGFDKGTIREKVMTAAASLQIEHLLDRKPADMSGGQRQRVAIGRAIVRQPKFFLFDEPLSNLDAKLRNQMRWEIAELHKRLGITTVYVTHDQVEAMTLGDHIVVMDKGLVQQTGSAWELYEKPVNKFVAGFIGTPPMNFFEGILMDMGEDLYFSNTEAGIHWPVAKGNRSLRTGDIAAGIRPEHLYIFSTQDKNRAPAIVNHTEYTGYETFAHLNMGGQSVISRISGHNAPLQGSKVWVEADPEKIHLFGQ